MADQVPAVCDILDAIERRNWPRLHRLLHPDVHWTTAVEEHLHGGQVIARVASDPPPAPPSYHEVRERADVPLDRLSGVAPTFGNRRLPAGDTSNSRSRARAVVVLS
jgi:hypothetical protein